MSQVHYILTCTFVEAICHIDFICEYFKIIKNGKAVRQKLNLFLENVSNPAILSENDINDFIESIELVESNEKWNFFKNSGNQPLKQKLTGFMVRVNCMEHFCQKLTNFKLHKFSITPAMTRLNNILLEAYKPVIIALTMSTKSKSNEQIKSFANLSFEDFNAVRSNRIELSRKMNKFEVWSVNEENERGLFERIQSETVLKKSGNRHNEPVTSLNDFEEQMPNTSTDLVEYIRSFTEY